MLVVNAALALLSKGHDVTIVTTHHSPRHCFAQTRGDGPLASRVVVVGDWLPRSLLGSGKGIALCSSLRMLYLALYLVLSSVLSSLSSLVRSSSSLACFDLVVADGVSTMVPLLRLGGFPVLFYCHFPDYLLCTERTGFLKRWYRLPLDFLEQWTTGCADRVVVNSRFTAGVFARAFPRLVDVKPTVIYPVADFGSFTRPDFEAKAEAPG